jgi:hypothetical protein
LNKDENQKKPVVFNVDATGWSQLTAAEKVEHVAKLRLALIEQMELEEQEGTKN